MRANLHTITGEAFEFLAPRQVSVFEIAHPLSNLCRFNGHCINFYSVAQHCVIATELVASSEGKLAVLLHDAAEAFLGDMTATLKRIMPEYCALEKKVQGLINEQFNVRPEWNEVTKTCDLMMLKAEKHLLMPQVEDEWEVLQNIPHPNRHVEEMITQKWTPQQARLRFIRKFNEILEAVNAGC